MFRRFQWLALLIASILFAFSLCSPNVFGAGDEASCLAAYEQAIALQKKGDYPGAARAYERALELATRLYGAEHQNTGAILNNLALLYGETGQYAKAEPLLRRSLKIVESQFGADHLNAATVLSGLADLYSRTGQYAKAEPLLRRSLEIRRSKVGPDDLLIAQSLNNLAALYWNMGHYAQAEPLYQRSLEINERKLGSDAPDVALSLNNLANLYLQMAKYAQAEPLLQRSLKIWELKLGPDHPRVAVALNNLASLYGYMDQSTQAEPLLQRSLKIFESKLGADHPDVARTLKSLADLYRNMSQYAQAEPLYQRSLKILESKLGADHPDVAHALSGLALVHWSMGQYAQAEPLYQRSLKIFASRLGPDHPYVATIGLHNLALVYAATARWSEAVSAVDRQRRIIRRHVARTLPALTEREQLTFLQTQDENPFHTALSLGLRQRSDSGAALRSAAWVLNGKAVAQEVLAQRAILATEGNDAALSEPVRQLLALRSQLAALSMTLPKTGQESDHRQQLETLGQQEQELSRRLGQAIGRNIAGDPWVEPSAVRQALPKETVLIEVVRQRVRNFQARGNENRWSGPHYAAWLIPAEGRGEITIVDLGEAAKIDDAVQAARKALERAEKTLGAAGEAEAEKQLHDPMRSLARLVFEPLETHLGDARQLILSPDAALWLIPWGALPLPDGKYAVEKYRISYVVSGRDLVSRSTRPGPKGTAPILFANPDYDLGPGQADAATRAVLRSAAPAEQVASNRVTRSLAGLGRVGRLPGTAEEAAAIKPSITRYTGAEAMVYEDQYALEGVFKALHRPQVLVLSTHGFFLPDQEMARDERSAEAGPGQKGRGTLTADGKPLENPLLRCGMLFAGCNQRVQEAPAGVDDGILTGLEIVGSDLRGTELVVLSACETGLGQVRNGEGVAGLRQAFQLAGAKAVLVTLWQIPDQETVELMNGFFSNLSSGQSKADALRNAQLSMIKSRRAANSAAHPYYWAGFTLTGD